MSEAVKAHCGLCNAEHDAEQVGAVTFVACPAVRTDERWGFDEAFIVVEKPAFRCRITGIEDDPKETDDV